MLLLVQLPPPVGFTPQIWLAAVGGRRHQPLVSGWVAPLLNQFVSGEFKLSILLTELIYPLVILRLGVLRLSLEFRVVALQQSALFHLGDELVLKGSHRYAAVGLA